MTTAKKVWLIVAALLVLAGSIMFVGVMTVLDWDFSKLGTNPYETNLHAITEDFQDISIRTNTAAITFLPSPDGQGRPMTQEELRQRMDRLEPRVFFSPQLCARYFTYMSRDTGAHFVLFDDGETLRKKQELPKILSRRRTPRCQSRFFQRNLLPM